MKQFIKQPKTIKNIHFVVQTTQIRLSSTVRETPVINLDGIETKVKMPRIGVDPIHTPMPPRWGTKPNRGLGFFRDVYPKDSTGRRLRPAFTKKMLKDRLDITITELRGGKATYDGGVDVSGEEWYGFLERTLQMSATLGAGNKNQAGWLFGGGIPSNLKGKLDWLLGKDAETLARWREGEMMNYQQRMKNWRQILTGGAPDFQWKPADPFRRKSWMIKRISYKDPRTLCKFLSLSGNILHPRFTGVRQKTQNRITREIKKARYLGLIPFTGNPEFISEKYQPKQATGYDIAAIVEEIRGTARTRDYLERLEAGMFHEFVAGKGIHPRHTAAKMRREYEGNLPHQRARRVAEMKSMKIMNRLAPDYHSIYYVPQLEARKKELRELGLKFKNENNENVDTKENNQENA